MNTRYTWTIPGRRKGKEGRGENEKRERERETEFRIDIREKYQKETKVETKGRSLFAKGGGKRFSRRAVRAVCTILNSEGSEEEKREARSDRGESERVRR